MRKVLALLVVAAGVTVLTAPGGTAATNRTAHDCVRGNELWFRTADGV